MEYQKIINLLDDTLDQPSKFTTTKCIERNYDLRVIHNTNS